MTFNKQCSRTRVTELETMSTKTIQGNKTVQGMIYHNEESGYKGIGCCSKKGVICIISFAKDYNTIPYRKNFQNCLELPCLWRGEEIPHPHFG